MLAPAQVASLRALEPLRLPVPLLRRAVQREQMVRAPVLIVEAKELVLLAQLSSVRSSPLTVHLGA